MHSGTSRLAFRLSVFGVSFALALGLAISARSDSSAGASKTLLSLSLARDYASLAELRRDADLVAVVTVAGEPKVSDSMQDIPTVDIPLRITHVLHGDARAGDIVTLMQVGDPTGQILVAEPLPAVLQIGRRYVLFMNKQFADQPQFVITGAVGAFEATNGSGYRRMGSANAALPLLVDESQF